MVKNLIKEALNPVLFPLFGELIWSDTQREALVLGAKYKRLVLPRSPVWGRGINWGSNRIRVICVQITSQCGKETVTTARRLATHLQSVGWGFQAHKGHVQLDLPCCYTCDGPQTRDLSRIWVRGIGRRDVTIA